MSSPDVEELFGRQYADGTVLFREGERGDEMYIVQEGAVEIKSAAAGGAIVYAVLERGSFFGEMALFDDKPRVATAVVKGGAKLMVLRRASVLDRLRNDPHIGLQLLRAMCQRIRSLSQGLEGIIARGDISPEEVDATLRAHSSH